MRKILFLVLSQAAALSAYAGNPVFNFETCTVSEKGAIAMQALLSGKQFDTASTEALSASVDAIATKLTKATKLKPKSREMSLAGFPLYNFGYFELRPWKNNEGLWNIKITHINPGNAKGVSGGDNMILKTDDLSRQLGPGNITITRVVCNNIYIEELYSGDKNGQPELNSYTMNLSDTYNVNNEAARPKQQSGQTANECSGFYVGKALVFQSKALLGGKTRARVTGVDKSSGVVSIELIESGGLGYEAGHTSEVSCHTLKSQM